MENDKERVSAQLDRLEVMTGECMIKAGDNYGKYLMGFSSGAIALSLTLAVNVSVSVAIKGMQFFWLALLSWGVTLILSLLSFRVASQCYREMLMQIQNRANEKTKRHTLFDRINKYIDVSSIFSFILAIVFIFIFLYINADQIFRISSPSEGENLKMNEKAKNGGSYATS